MCLWQAATADIISSPLGLPDPIPSTPKYSIGRNSIRTNLLKRLLPRWLQNFSLSLYALFDRSRLAVISIRVSLRPSEFSITALQSLNQTAKPQSSTYYKSSLQLSEKSHQRPAFVMSSQAVGHRPSFRPILLLLNLDHRIHSLTLSVIQLLQSSPMMKRSGSSTIMLNLSSATRKPPPTESPLARS